MNKRLELETQLGDGNLDRKWVMEHDRLAELMGGRLCYEQQVNLCSPCYCFWELHILAA
jgi:hypothetical protein